MTFEDTLKQELEELCTASSADCQLPRIVYAVRMKAR